MALSNTTTKQEREMNDLTEKEKWECTARWLNALYLEDLSQIPMTDVGDGDLSIEEALHSETNYLPCAVCPIERKCRKVNAGKVLPQTNFKIMEQFTGKDTIVDQWLPKYVFTKLREEHMDNHPSNSDHYPLNDNKSQNDNM